MKSPAYQVTRENIERFIEGQAFLWSYDSATRPLSPPYPIRPTKLTGRLRKRVNLLAREAGRARIIRPQESLALYKSFNTLCRDLSLTGGPISSMFSHLLNDVLHDLKIS
jgi:hypothetical protein